MWLKFSDILKRKTGTVLSVPANKTKLGICIFVSFLSASFSQAGYFVILYLLENIYIYPFTLNSPKNLEGFGGTAYLAFTNFRLPSSKRI